MIEKVKLIEFPKILDERGNLTFLQNNDQIPFEIQRVFWTYDVPGGEIRGGHAYKSQHEVVISLSGSFDVIVRNKLGEVNKFQLNRSYYGLYLPPNTWRHMENFSTNALGLHLSSSVYSEEDYIRDFHAFQNQAT
jgi:dTDP-4-dehydrorhamnose 3,5-epimerase-like enzyme